MAKIDLYDPKWIEMVFADKNKEYGAYVLRKGTSSRNIKALLILVIVAALVGGGLAYKIHQNKVDAERQAYLEQLELQKLQEAAKKEKKEEIKVQPKVEQKKEIPEVRYEKSENRKKINYLRCASHRSSPLLSSRRTTS